jgi:hypothetical protein
MGDHINISTLINIALQRQSLGRRSKIGKMGDSESKRAIRSLSASFINLATLDSELTETDQNLQALAYCSTAIVSERERCAETFQVESVF